MQASFDRMGCQLIGTTPGPRGSHAGRGEARLRSCLRQGACPKELLRPRAQDLTPGVKALFDLLFRGNALINSVG